MALEFAADFETSKIIKYEEIKAKKNQTFDEEGNYIKPRQAFRFIEGDEKKPDELIPALYVPKKIDRKNSKTWVYHWGIMKLNLQDFEEGYSIDSFMDYIINYPEDMNIFFHNEKFDGTFILYYMLKHDFKQLLEERNQLTTDAEKKASNSIFYDDTKNHKIPQFFKRVKLTDAKGICQEDHKYFTSSVNHMGVMYSITIYILEKGKKVKTINIYDSLKLLNFSIESLGKDFLNEKLPKLKIDYDLVRPANRPDLLTQQDHDYLKRDIEIAARCLTILKTSKDIDGDTDKLTIASLALDDFKELWARKTHKKVSPSKNDKKRAFLQAFPVLESDIDDFLRQAYKGGFCYAFPKTQNKINERKEGMCVLDVNSLFPSVMLNNALPVGQPFHVVGDTLKKDGYKVPTLKGYDSNNNPIYDDTLYDYYFVNFTCEFKLKKDKIPSIMFKGSDVRRNSIKTPCPIRPNEYLESSEGIELNLIMTKDDYELMNEQYDVINEKILEVYYFETWEGIFDEYIKKWAAIKIQAGKDKNKSRRALAKLFLNSLYGKFGSKCRNSFKYFYIGDGNNLSSDSKCETVDNPIFTPMAAAITAGGRKKTILASQKILDYGLKKYNKYCYFYSDTDSIHTFLTRDEVIECLGDDVDVNETGEFGLWDIEEDNIIKSKFIRTKTYFEEREDGTIKSGVAGLPSNIQKCLTWDSFDKGIIIIGKLMPTQVEGGTALIESTFEIK